MQSLGQCRNVAKPPWVGLFQLDESDVRVPKARETLKPCPKLLSSAASPGTAAVSPSGLERAPALHCTALHCRAAVGAKSQLMSLLSCIPPAVHCGWQLGPKRACSSYKAAPFSFHHHQSGMRAVTSRPGLYAVQLKTTFLCGPCPPLAETRILLLRCAVSPQRVLALQFTLDFLIWSQKRRCRLNLVLAFQVVSQRLSTVDLSCYSLEEVPEHLFYSQDITYLNLRHNFMRPSGSGGLDSLCRSVLTWFHCTGAAGLHWGQGGGSMQSGQESPWSLWLLPTGRRVAFERC